MSSWAECPPCYPAECFQRVTRKYQSSVLLGTCQCSTESWRPGIYFEILQPPRSISKPGQDLTDISHPEHREPSLSVFITRFVLLKASVFSASAELSELGLVRLFFFSPFLGRSWTKPFLFLWNVHLQNIGIYQTQNLKKVTLKAG